MSEQNIPLHERQECRIEAIWIFELIRVLTKEQDTLIYQLANN